MRKNGTHVGKDHLKMKWIMVLGLLCVHRHWTEGKSAHVVEGGPGLRLDEPEPDTIPDNHHREEIPEKELWLDDFINDKVGLLFFKRIYFFHFEECLVSRFLSEEGPHGLFRG